MWHSAQPLQDQPDDVANFIELINAQASFFASDAPTATLWIGRAPGRLDLMGGIADYSGSLVLEMPLAVATLVAVQAQTEPVLEVLNTAASEPGASTHLSLPLGPVIEALGNETLPDYQTVRQLLKAEPSHSWVIYPLGVLLLLQQHAKFPLDRGLRLFIHSTVPVGKGVSSSAALEVATLQALCGLYDLKLSGPEMAIIAQQAENLVVGAPCGIMDQMTAACGQANRLLALLCQPAELESPLDLPAEVAVWGLDSGIRHAVSGTDYGSVRVGAFMGYRILSSQAGLAVTEQMDKTHLKINDPRWQGYLANVSPSEWEMRYANAVPEYLNGAEFLARWGGTTDPITTVDPARRYSVRQPTAHPIYENHRVQLFRALLNQAKPDETSLKLLGELMYQSHASYSRCGLGSDGTDRLVELVRQAGPDSGLYGAKITGGGSGGMVAVLGHPEAYPTIKAIVARYEQETGRHSLILSGSSPGAASFGGLSLSFENFLQKIFKS